MKTENSKNIKIHSLLSVLVIALGVTLLIFMIVVEDEPGAIPLLLIILGVGWYLITRIKSRTSTGRSGAEHRNEEKNSN